jgi:methylenetetrahydrofolate reductase (NADPH)
VQYLEQKMIEEIKEDAVNLDTRLVDLVDGTKGGKPFMSIEFFPPKTDAGVPKLYNVLEELHGKYQALFADVTWGAGGSTSDLTLDLCKEIKKRGVIPNLHLTCTNMEKEKIDKALAGCVEAGITNILALRGDPPQGQTVWHATEGGLTCALDLVKYIRKSYANMSNELNITVAGYPEGHPAAMTEVLDGLESLTETEKKRCSIEKDAESGLEKIICCRDGDYDKELAYLKEKCDAGANAIITQMFFDAEVYRQFVLDCRRIGIAETIPIIPGIMCISTFAGFNRMVGFCKTRVPDAMREAMDNANKAIDDSEAAVAAAAAKVKEVGLELILGLCRDLLSFGQEVTPGLHFYTLNQGLTTSILCDKLREESLIR